MPIRTTLISTTDTHIERTRDTPTLGAVIQGSAVQMGPRNHQGRAQVLLIETELERELKQPHSIVQPVPAFRP